MRRYGSRDGVYLLCKDAPADRLSRLLHAFRSGAVHDLCRVMPPPMPLWKGRFSMTLIEPGQAVRECMLSLALTMHTLGYVHHPAEWKQCGWRENVGIRKRYRIVSPDAAVVAFLGQEGRPEELSDRLIALVEDCLHHDVRPSVTDWEEPIAVGGPDWIRHLAQTLPESWRQIRPFQTPSLPAVPTAGLQAIHVSRNRARPCVYSLLRRHAAHPPA